MVEHASDICVGDASVTSGGVYGDVQFFLIEVNCPTVEAHYVWWCCEGFRAGAGMQVLIVNGWMCQRSARTCL